MAAVDLEYNKGFQIYNANGTKFHDLVLHKCTYETVVMSLGDKISGILYYKDNALGVKMTEYIIYKGVKYTLVNPPTILKEGLVSDNGELKGMTKYSFTFYHPMYVLNNFSFNDVAVSSDQNKYLSQNKTFSWIGNLNDYVAKINKNLQGTEWIVKVGDNVTQEEKTKLSDVLSFDKNTIAEALKRGYETWEVPYIVDSIHPNEYLYIDEHNVQRDYYDDDKHFVVLFGLPTTEITVKDDNGFETPFVFKMGQGVGLKNNSRNPKNNKIITRIAGYGSEDNIPYGYPQIRYYGGTVQYPLYYGIVGGQRVQLIKHPFTRNHLMPSVYGQAVYNKVNPKLSDGSNNPNYNPDIELVDYYDADSTYANPIKSSSPSYEIHEFGDIKPELGEETIINAVPVNAQETQSDYKHKSDFLQEILNRISSTDIDDEKVCLKTLYDKVDAGLSYYAQKGEEGGSEYWYRISVTSDDYYQYVSYESGNYNFTATVLKNDSSAPTPDWDDTMDDDGKYLQSYFKITLPILSFDLYACAAITQEMKINMRSGACIGCTFPVQVDWDDYKRNFYNSDGEFDPDGEQRDYTKYPDSSSGQITVMVKKELETFGTLMPNQYQQPTTGDKFVILGISLPESYITNAEQRLDTDMKQYMRDNNVYYYEYPLKFDEHFLISNENILSQMKPNVVVRFEYAGETHALYIKQMSVKYNESPLPKYDITLTDDIEIVLNQIGQVTDEVSKLRLGLGDGGGFGGNGQEYLRKDIDDTARGTIRMVKGMQVGERFVTGLLGEGGVFRKDVDGTTYLETDKLYVRMKAYFDTVEVKHYLHTGGNRIASQASGIVCSRVEYINNNGDVITDLGEAVLFRCYFKANDGDKTIRNDFMIGDLAFCRETNVDVSEVNMHSYWRLVIGRNGNGSLTENKEAWIDLSNRASETLTIDGIDYVCNGYQNGSDAPIAQDDIIQLGNIANKDRQGAIVEYVGGEDAPSYQIFQGIGEDLPYPYTLEDKNYIGLGYSTNTGHAYMNVYGDVFIGAKPDSVTEESPTYIKYVQEDSETGEPKLSIKAEVEFIHSDGQGGSTSTTMDDFVKSIEDSFKDIQDQIDGEIDTWYYEGVPTLLNLPASEWNTDELKREHIGDLYYDKENGDAYRFIFDTSVEPNEYKWIQIHDDALAEALRLAADAKETADNKRRVFLTQPIPPYDEGDLWVNATYPANSDSTDAEHNRYYNDVLCAKKAVPRTEGEQEITAFSINDWVLASKYTDDAKFDRYINQILNGTGASGDSAIVANAIRAIKGALNEATIIDGGLVLTSLINLRSNNKTWAGISGQYDATAKGYGIASWYGGGMADWEVYKETHPSATIDDTYAKSLFRFDGSGYLAGGNITWDDQGRVAIKDITTLVGGNNTDILNALTTFNSAFHFNTQQGETTVLSIVPQAGFTSLNITENGTLKPVATQEWVGQNYISVAFFDRLFRAYNGDTLVNANDTKSTIDNIKAMFGFWTEKYISALGKGDDGGTSTFNESQMWTALGGSISNKQVALSHLTTALSGYAQTSALSAYVKGVKVNGTSYTTKDANGIVDLGEIKADTSDFVTLSTAQTITGIKTFNSRLSISDGTDEKVLLRADNEGGNIRIVSPAVLKDEDGNQRFWEMDSFNGNLRFYTRNSGQVSMKMGTDGFLTTTGQGKLWGVNNDGANSGLDADLLDGQHGSYYATATDVTTLQGYFTDGVANSAAKLNDTETHKFWNQTYWLNGRPSAADITGDLTGTGKITTSKVTTTWRNGNLGEAIINSSATAGAFVMLAKMNTTNGVMTHGVHQQKYVLQYTSNTTISGTENKVDRTTVLMDEGGAMNVSGTLTVNGRFIYVNHDDTIKARLYADGEGGNLQLTSGQNWLDKDGWEGHFWEMDSFDGNLRFYNFLDKVNGDYREVKFYTDGSVKANRLYLYKPNDDNDTNAVYLLYDSNGGVHLVGAGFYADTFVSALGKSDSGSSSVFDETAMWNALGIAGASHKIHNDHLSLGTLTINGDTWNPATSGNKTINITSADGYITPIASGNVNTAKGDGNVWFKKANVSSDSTPNNGVVIEYGNSTSWVGQLYLGDNANQGLYWNGWYDGVRGTWKKIAFADDYLPLAGGTMTGQIKTSFKSSVAMGSYEADATTIPDLCEELRYSSGVSGSANITSVYTKDGVTISAKWYNFIWMPHRTGGFNGAATLDNANFGSLLLSAMTGSAAECYLIRFATQSIQNVVRLLDSSNDGNGSGLDADLLDGQHGSYYATASGLTAANTNITTLQGYFTNGVAKSAGDSAKLSGKSIVTKNLNKPYDSVMYIDDVGGMEVGKWFDFHYDNTTGSDFSTRLLIGGNYSNQVTLPSGTGTLALTSDNVASASKLKDSHSLWGNSFNGTQDIFGNIEIRLNNKPKVRLYANNEGGNIRIYSPDSYTINNERETNHFWEIDSYNGNLRIYNYNSSYAYKGVSLSRDLDFSGLMNVSATGNLSLGTGDGTYIQIGGARIVWDNANTALKVVKSDGTTAANFYATGAVSAIGANASGGSGSGIDANWLKTNDVQIQRLGIGVAPSSSYQLNVQGASNFTGALTVNSSVSAVGGFSTSQGSISAAHDITAGGNGLVHNRLTVGQSSVNTRYNLYVNGTSYFNGDVGIGYYSSGFRLYVSGKVRLSNLDIYEENNTITLKTNDDDLFLETGDGTPYYRTAWQRWSDMNLKNIVRYINDLTIEKISKTPLFVFRWKDEGNSGREQVGTSAQYWNDILPQSVVKTKNGVLTLDYSSIALASAVVTARKVVDHELRIKQLEQENAILREEIKSLKAA